jgi:hypothetical protein
LHAPGQAAAVLSNWGEAGTAAVRFPASTSAVEIISGNPLELLHVDGYSQAVVRLPKGGCAVVLAELRSNG